MVNYRGMNTEAIRRKRNDMNCKHCNAELGENAKFCSNCGKPVNEPEQAAPMQPTYCDPEIREEKKSGAGKIALIVAVAVVAFAAVVALVLGLGKDGVNQELSNTNDPTLGSVEATEAPEATVPADGNPDDATCKGTYTVTDEEAIAAGDTVVATMGDNTLTVSQLQVYYWSEVIYFLQEYGSYAAYFGLDYTQPLDTQLCTMTETQMTWQQYFLACALDSWTTYQSMTLEANAAGVTIPEDLQAELDALPADLDEAALGFEMADGAELVKSNFGACVSMEDYLHYWNLYYTGYEYYNSEYEKMIPTAEEVEAYFTENEALYAENEITRDSGKYVDVRHILIMVEGGTTDEEGNTTYSDEEWETCRAEAQAILDEWLAGEATEDTFAALANEKSEDSGSNTVGGLYENVYVDQMVPEFNDWCFDEARAYGDYALVRTDYGYHVMFFSAQRDIWFYNAEMDLLNERMSTLVPAAIEAHPYEIDYSAIVLATVALY